MGKRPPIRITENDRKEHARMVRNARAKIRRVEKQMGVDNLEKSGIDLNEIMPLPKIDEFASRKELNEWKEKQQDFTNQYNIDYKFQKNQHGMVTTRRRLKNYEDKNAREIRIAEDEIARLKGLPFHVRGEKQGTLEERVSHMKESSALGVRVPPVFNFDGITHKGRFDTLDENMDKRANRDYYDGRKETLKENFIVALMGTFNGEEKELVDLIDAIPANDFYELWLGESDMEFSKYDSHGQETHAGLGHIDRITDYMAGYFTGNVNSASKDNLDLKDF